MKGVKMNLKQYITSVLHDIDGANTNIIHFDIGVDPDDIGVCVNNESTNRIKFTIIL